MNRNIRQLKRIKQKIKQIQNKNIDTNIKLRLIQSINEQLRIWSIEGYYSYSSKIDKQQSQDTYLTDYSRQYILKDIDEMQLENRILQKRKIKIELNEQIQTIEDDLFEQQKIIQTKRQLDSEMNEEIKIKASKISYEQENDGFSSPRPAKFSLKKKSNSVTSLFKKIFA